MRDFRIPGIDKLHLNPLHSLPASAIESFLHCLGEVVISSAIRYGVKHNLRLLVFWPF